MKCDSCKIMEELNKSEEPACCRWFMDTRNGELPPKEQPRLSKRQMDALIRKRIEDTTGITELRKYLGNNGSIYF